MASETYGNPLLIPDDQDPVTLQRISVSGSNYNEEFVQRLAFEYPSCLPVSEIDRAYEGLVPVCMELSCPSGYMDALYVTRKGRLIIVESKLWRNPEARRKVIAQILDYAKDLSRWSYEDLQREVSKALKRKGNVLFELVKEKYPDTDEAQFVDEVQQSLRRGRFLLVILGDGIREGAAAIADFLESSGSLEFTFGLVELALYEAAGIGRFVQPRILARSAIIERRIVQLDAGMRFVDEETGEVDQQDEQAEDKRFYKTFWADFLESLELDDPGQPLANVNTSTNAYFALPPSGATTWVSPFFSKYKERVGVYITWTRGPFADAAYEYLLSEKEKIEEELGLQVEWSSKDGRHRVSVHKSYDDVWAESNRTDIEAFFANAVNRFVNTFRGRMKRVAEDMER